MNPPSRSTKSGGKNESERPCQIGSFPFSVRRGGGFGISAASFCRQNFLPKGAEGAGIQRKKEFFSQKNGKFSSKTGKFRVLAYRLLLFPLPGRRRQKGGSRYLKRTENANGKNNRMSIAESTRLIIEERNQLWQTVKKSLVSILERPTLW